MTTKPDYKKYGFIPQRQKGFLIMRIRNRAGNLPASSLCKIADLAERFGSGEVHITVRQGIEIPNVKEELFEKAHQAILEAGLLAAVCGPRVRPVMACPGNNTCPYGLLNTQILAEKLDMQYVGRDLPAKTKFAVCGCANACTKPQTHDVGFRGASEPIISHEQCVKCGGCVRRCPAKAMTIENKALVIDYDKCLSCGVCMQVCPKQALKTGRLGYHIYVGGKGGRYTNDGVVIAKFVQEEEVLSYLNAILVVYEELAEKGQRLYAVLSKFGAQVIQEKVEKLRSVISSN
ncbi:MAG: ndhI 1 [Firmicutes bacterium]|nr:ndhI 1 [Bacillota bacterium]